MVIYIISVIKKLQILPKNSNAVVLILPKGWLFYTFLCLLKLFIHLLLCPGTSSAVLLRHGQEARGWASGPRPEEALRWGRTQPRSPAWQGWPLAGAAKTAPQASWVRWNSTNNKQMNRIVWWHTTCNTLCLFTVCSPAHWSMLVLSGQSSGGETPGHQHRNTRELVPLYICYLWLCRGSSCDRCDRCDHSATWPWLKEAWPPTTCWSSPSGTSNLW